MKRSNAILLGIIVSVLLVVGGLLSGVANAHCDTFAGPVLIEAQKALESGTVTPLLKWVPAEQEEAITQGFSQALKRRVSDRQGADASFFELLVRIHREGEGAAFTGVKPPGAVLPPAILAADRALEAGSSREVIEVLSKELLRSVRATYERALEKKRTADRSVAEGREYVDAYVEYVHHVEAISGVLSGAKAPGKGCRDASPASDGCSSCAGHKK